MLDASIISIEDFFNLGRFKPAAVQRDYHWDTAQCNDLLNDLERAIGLTTLDPPDTDGDAHSPLEMDDAANEPQSVRDLDEAIEVDLDPGDAPPSSGPAAAYHLGTIILRPLPHGQFEIYDGLQRTACLTIMMAALRDRTSSKELRQRLHNLIETTGGFRVILPGKDQTLTNEVQQIGQAVKALTRDTSQRGRRIRRAKRQFNSQFKHWDEGRLRRFVDFILRATKVTIHITGDQALARQIFVTTNVRGIPLNRVDLFKGQLADIAADDATAKAIIDQWNSVEHRLGTQLDDFMFAFDFVTRSESQGADCLSKLIDFLQLKYGSADILQWIGQLVNHAMAWEEMGYKLRDPNCHEAMPSIWRLTFFRWNEWKPLALAWYADFMLKRNKVVGGAGMRAQQTMQRRFDGLHRACMAITLLKLSELDRAKIFRNALMQQRRGRNPFTTTKDAEGKYGALSFTPRSRRRMAHTLIEPQYDDEIRLCLVRWLESALWDDSELRNYLYKSTSIEHILPVRPEPDSQWVRDFPDPEERYKSCHSIGNLAAMDWDTNKKLNNGEFAAKLPTYQAQIAQYKNFADVLTAKRWTAKVIAARTNTMIDQAWHELRIPRPG